MRIAAKYRMLLDFHGCPPPTGLQKQFPNVLNYEGIFGLEQMRNRALPQYDMVSFDVTAPFIRFVTGPADYTPGAFLNGTRETFVPYKPAPMSQGTRCHQLAEYVVFDGPMQMLCDGPARYEAEPECAEFIYRVPTVWDETRVLDGRIGDYIVTARRKGDTWYIGALTDWNARDLVVDLWALGLPEASVEAWEDGPDAEVLGKAVFSIERKVGRSHPEKIAFSIDIDESHLILYGPVRFVGRGRLCLCQFEHRKQHEEGKETFWHAHLRVIRFNSAKMQRTEEKVMSGFYQNLSRKIILFRDYTHPSF